MYQYQYDGRAKWVDILAWCSKNIDGQFYCNGFETIAFDNEKAYAWFLLRWK